MESNAKSKFNKNIDDIEALLEIHGLLEDMGRDVNRPPPQSFDVLFSSATVLLVSNWEAYIEDACSEALEFLIFNSVNSEKIPKEIKKQISKEIQNNSSNEIEMWKLSDDGWKEYLRNRLSAFKKGRDKSFNTPKSTNTSEFIKNVLGLENIHNCWEVDGLDSSKVAEKLDHLVSVRGEIAHRAILEDTLNEQWVTDYLGFIRNLSSETDMKINSHIEAATGKKMW